MGPSYLTCTNLAPSGNWVTVIATQPKSSGKNYAEFVVDQIGASGVALGLFKAGGILNDFIGDTGNGWGISKDGTVFAGSGGTPTNGSAFTTGDVIGMAVDYAGGTIAFTKNNSANGGVTGITFSTAIYLATSAINLPEIITLQTTAADCTYSPPATFSNWN